MKNVHRINEKIYITSDEEIKFNDYITDGQIQSLSCSLLGKKKIILTTDQDLIKDGVQAIDDTFLEWFVKNPSCEEVEVEYNEGIYDLSRGYPLMYKIIIPKEEPKQETLEKAAERLYPVHKMYFPTSVEDLNKIPRSIFIDGAKWQQERMYSEEEVQVKLYECLGHFAQKHNIIIKGSEINQWFEQFKKKPQ